MTRRDAPIGHRRGPGMIGKPVDHHVIALNRDDALDDADRNTLFLESAALLDVKFEIAVVCARLLDGLLDAIRIAADAPDAVAALQAIPGLVEIACLQIARNNPARRRAAAERRAFFVRPQHHLERMTGSDRGRLAGLDHFERGQRAEIAVEITAAGHRVDVRAEQNRRASGRAARGRGRPSGEDIAGRIDPRREPGGFDFFEQPRPCRDVGVGIRHAADA
jgi:hypothetical protein